MPHAGILTFILLLALVNAEYISYLLGPLGTGGSSGSALTQLNSYTTELGSTAIALGQIINITDATKNLDCNLGGQTSEAPLVAAYTNQTIYTMCSTSVDGKPMKALMMVEPPMKSMKVVGWTSAFQGQSIINLATDYGHRFYFLTKSEASASVNTTLWTIHPSQDLTRITNSSTDGWILSTIAIYYNQLYAIGYMPSNPVRRILTFSGVLPNTPMRPFPLPGFPAFPVASQLVTFTLTAPDSIWVVIGLSASIGSSTLQNFAFDPRQRLWGLRGQFNFNVSYPIPYSIGSSPKGAPVIFHGTTFSQLIEYGLPSASAGGNGAVLNTRILSTAPYGVTYRSLAIIQYLPTLTPTPSAAPSSSAYASPSMGVTQTPSISPSVSVNVNAKYSNTVIYTHQSTSSSSSSFSAAPSVSAAPSASVPSSASASVSVPSSASVSASASASASVSTSINPTPNPNLNPGNAPAAEATKRKEDIAIGVGIIIPLLVIGISIATILLLRSGKLSMLMRRVQTFQWHPKGSSRKSPRLPTRASTLSKIPDIQMNINPAVLKQIAIDRFNSMKMAEQHAILNEKHTVKKSGTDNRITFQPVKINTSSALSPHMNEPVGFVHKGAGV